MRRVLCVQLPHWPIDRLCRRHPELRGKPLALVKSTANRQAIVHVSPAAPAGIYPGMALAEGRARCAELVDHPITPTADLRGLEALGRRLMQYSPRICVAPPTALFLDATGLERLFGGLDALLGQVDDALASLRIAAAMAIAPTPGAAWALAAYGNGRSRIVTAEQVTLALASLPPAALRLDRQTVDLLSALGVRTIRALLQLPRDELAVRFGPSMLIRIDQATGAAHETMTFLAPRMPIRATLEFESPIESLEILLAAVLELAQKIAGQLAERGMGAKELRLTFYQPYGPPVEKAIRLIRPCRGEAGMMKLLECALEQVKCGEGFIAATLAVPSAVRLGDEQTMLIGEQERRDAAELDHLVERLRARLERCVEWGELVESNLPEHSSRSCDAAVKANAPGNRVAVDLLRPLRLLRQPRAIDVIVRPSESREGHPISYTDRGQVHRLDHIRGPERITGQWWAGRWKIRDYFDVLDSAGGRYWIFRVAQTGRWFLHGIFA